MTAAPYQRFVLIGGYHRLSRAWVRARGISPQQVVEVRGLPHLVRLRGMRGQGVALVWLDGLPAPGALVPSLIGLLRSQGAVDLPPTWWPDLATSRRDSKGIGGTDEEDGGEDR